MVYPQREASACEAEAGAGGQLVGADGSRKLTGRPLPLPTAHIRPLPCPKQAVPPLSPLYSGPGQALPRASLPLLRAWLEPEVGAL